MKIANLKIVNYRGLREIEIPFSNFVCLIGENNTGKSSILQCLSLFFSGSKLDSADYYDESRNVKIGATIEGIGATDINRLAEEHRSRISNIVKDSKLVLIREYDTSAMSQLKIWLDISDNSLWL